MEQFRHLMGGPSAFLALVMGAVLVLTVLATVITPMVASRKHRQLSRGPQSPSPDEGSTSPETRGTARNRLDPLSAEAAAVRLLLTGEIDRATYRARMREVTGKADDCRRRIGE